MQVFLKTGAEIELLFSYAYAKNAKIYCKKKLVDNLLKIFHY